jgi:hypothetical protein
LKPEVCLVNIKGWLQATSLLDAGRLLTSDFRLRRCERHPRPPRSPLLSVSVHLVDAVTEHEAGRRLVAVKNVTFSEDFFQGHFPGAPLMPGVLMLETLTQVAAILLLERDGLRPPERVSICAVSTMQIPARRCSWRSVAAGNTLSARRQGLARVQRRHLSAINSSPRRCCCWASVPIGPRSIRPRVVDPGAKIGEGTTIGPHAAIGPNVPSAATAGSGVSVIDGWTEIGDETEIYPFASIGQAPQDLKFQGEETRLVDRQRNIFREFVTIHRGTSGGGWRHADRRSQCLHGLRARRARLPCRQRHHFRQHGDARRPRDG